MKVAYIEELFKLIPHGGIAVLSKRLTDYFNENGIKTDILSYSDAIQANIPDFIKVFPNVREIFVYPNYGKRALPAIEKNYDLLHLASPHTLAFYKPVIPNLVTIHYLISRQALMLGKYLPPKYKIFFNTFSYHLFAHYERKGLNNARVITVARQAYKDYLVEHLQQPAEKIHIIKNGIDYHLFCPPEDLKQKERMVVYVGRGSLPKGFDTLVRAAKNINAQVMAVASQIPENLQQEINKLDNFTVCTGISQDELIKLYQQSFLYIMPSLTEVSPISTLEAMACGLPVVATPEGSGEYIEDGDGGYVIPFNDPQQLAEKVNFLLENKKLASEFGLRNRQKVEKELNLPVICSQYMQLYRKLAAGEEEVYVNESENL